MSVCSGQGIVCGAPFFGRSIVSMAVNNRRPTSDEASNPTRPACKPAFDGALAPVRSAANDMVDPGLRSGARHLMHRSMHASHRNRCSGSEACMHAFDRFLRMHRVPHSSHKCACGAIRNPQCACLSTHPSTLSNRPSYDISTTLIKSTRRDSSQVMERAGSGTL